MARPITMKTGAFLTQVVNDAWSEIEHALEGIAARLDKDTGNLTRLGDLVRPPSVARTPPSVTERRKLRKTLYEPEIRGLANRLLERVVDDAAEIELGDDTIDEAVHTLDRALLERESGFAESDRAVVLDCLARAMRSLLKKHETTVIQTDDRNLTLRFRSKGPGGKLLEKSAEDQTTSG